MPLSTVTAMNPPNIDSAQMRKAVLSALLAAAAFAVTGACVKFAASDASNSMVVFFRNVVALALLLPWVISKGLGELKTQRWGGHMLRAAFGVTAMYCFFFALGKMVLADAVLLNYSSPLFIPLIAWLWIGEKPPWIIIPASILGIIGIAFIVKPGGDGLVSFPALIGALSGVLAAAAMVSIRRLSRTEPTIRIVFYFSLLATIISAIPLAWGWKTVSPHTWLAMLGAGTFAVIGQLGLTRAYSLATAARVGAFTYTSVVFAAGIGWVFWNEAPDLFSVFGAVLVVGTCILATIQTGQKVRVR